MTEISVFVIFFSYMRKYNIHISVIRDADEKENSYFEWKDNRYGREVKRTLWRIKCENGTEWETYCCRTWIIQTSAYGISGRNASSGWRLIRTLKMNPGWSLYSGFLIGGFYGRKKKNRRYIHHRTWRRQPYAYRWGEYFIRSWEIRASMLYRREITWFYRRSKKICRRSKNCSEGIPAVWGLDPQRHLGTFPVGECQCIYTGEIWGMSLHLQTRWCIMRTDMYELMLQYPQTLASERHEMLRGASDVWIKKTNGYSRCWWISERICWYW